MTWRQSPYYQPGHSLREARELYFSHFGFDGGGYEERWVKLKAGPFAISFPNTRRRVIAARYHDLHHILTGYPANWIGEAEIGAWEIASGCADHYPAWVLNLGAMAVGFALAPRKVFHAFLRGRRSRNLYREAFTPQLLEETVGDARRRLLPREASPAMRAADLASFACWAAVSLTLVLAPLAAALALVLLVAG